MNKTTTIIGLILRNSFKINMIVCVFDSSGKTKVSNECVYSNIEQEAEAFITEYKMSQKMYISDNFKDGYPL